MKREWIILFRIIFVTIVFLSIGIDAHANHFIQQCNIEQSAETENTEHIFSQNSDYATEDQIDQTFTPVFTSEHLSQIILPQINVVFCNYSPSVWQPPKLF